MFKDIELFYHLLATFDPGLPNQQIFTVCFILVKNVAKDALKISDKKMQSLAKRGSTQYTGQCKTRAVCKLFNGISHHQLSLITVSPQDSGMRFCQTFTASEDLVK